jgi:predicted transcriptional regulator
MTQKRLVLDAISELPDEVSLDEIAERVEFLAAIQKGLDQLDRGEGIPHEEVKRQLATWLTPAEPTTRIAQNAPIFLSGCSRG